MSIWETARNATNQGIIDTFGYVCILAASGFDDLQVEAPYDAEYERVEITEQTVVTSTQPMVSVLKSQLENHFGPDVTSEDIDTITIKSTLDASIIATLDPSEIEYDGENGAMIYCRLL